MSFLQDRHTKKLRGNYLHKKCQEKMNATAKKYILFLHAVSGSDTTSALFGQGKKEAATMFEKRADILPMWINCMTLGPGRRK